MTRSGRRTRIGQGALLGLVVVVLAVLAVTLSAARSPGADVPAVTSKACGTAPRPRGETFTISVPTTGGPAMSVLVHVPGRVRGTAAPLVLAFHGSNGDGAGMRRSSHLQEESDAKGFVVAFPSAPSPIHSWQLHAQRSTARNDVEAVGRALDRIEETTCIDPARVFATGVSNGGGFTARLGCELPTRIAAIAVVAGGFRAVDRCPTGPPVSVLEIHGTGDVVVPYGGLASDGHRGAVLTWLDQWVARDGCRPSPIEYAVTTTVHRFRWAGCTPSFAVRHIKVLGLKHGWPDPTSPYGRPVSPISGANEVWQFFASLKPRGT